MITVLQEMLLHLDGTPRVLSLNDDPLAEWSSHRAVSVDGPEDSSGTDRVDRQWRQVQDELDPDAMEDGFENHAYVRWFFLNNRVMPDFVGMAHEVDPHIASGLVERYESRCRGGVDDHADRKLDPRSKSAQHVYYLTRLVSQLPDLPRRHVLEIGGGFGNFARIALQLSMCAGYDALDIRNVIELQRRYLESCVEPAVFDEVRFHTVEDEDAMAGLRERRFGLVVSTFALTETPPAMRDWSLQLINGRADAVFIAGQESFGGESVGDQITSALEASFDVARTPMRWESSNLGPCFEILARRR